MQNQSTLPDGGSERDRAVDPDSPHDARYQNVSTRSGNSLTRN